MKRLNVSLSRAKKKLIVVGDMQTLTNPDAHYEVETEGIKPLDVFKKLASLPTKVSLSKTNIEHFFDSEYDPNVENITQVDLSYLISENLIPTNSLFKGCISLKSINLAFQNKVSLTNMDSMFAGCSSLESIDFSYINTSSLINMDSLFSGFILLKKINLSELKNHQ